MYDMNDQLFDNTDHPNRRQVIALGGAALVGAMLPAQIAHAGRRKSYAVKFMAWSGTNPDIFCVRVSDKDKGNRFEIHQIGTPKPLEKVKVKPEQEREVFNKRFADYSFIVPGTPGMTAPNGWQIFGQFEQKVLRIGISDGRTSRELGRVAARPDSASGSFAKVSLQRALWSPDSMRVVAVVRQYNKVQGFLLDIEQSFGFKIG